MLARSLLIKIPCWCGKSGKSALSLTLGSLINLLVHFCSCMSHACQSGQQVSVVSHESMQSVIRRRWLLMSRFYLRMCSNTGHKQYISQSVKMIYLHGKPITPILNPFNQAQAVDVEEVTLSSCPYPSGAPGDRTFL